MVCDIAARLADRISEERVADQLRRDVGSAFSNRIPTDRRQSLHAQTGYRAEEPGSPVVKPRLTCLRLVNR